MIKPPWLVAAYKELGTAEKPGVDHNIKILAYHLETTLKATDDETPWCSAFVCAMLEWNGIPSTRSARARSWLDWGMAVDAPQLGCICILWRGRPEGPMGHVGFYVGESETHVRLLGGNQSNKVCVAAYSKERLLGYRWPTSEQWEDHEGDYYSTRTH